MDHGLTKIAKEVKRGVIFYRSLFLLGAPLNFLLNFQSDRLIFIFRVILMGNGLKLQKPFSKIESALYNWTYWRWSHLPGNTVVLAVASRMIKCSRIFLSRAPQVPGGIWLQFLILQCQIILFPRWIMKERGSDMLTSPGEHAPMQHYLVHITASLVNRGWTHPDTLTLVSLTLYVT